MFDGLLKALGVAGDVIDTPGAFVRTAASGRNPFPGVFDPSQRASGRSGGADNPGFSHRPRRPYDPLSNLDNDPFNDLAR